MYGPKFGFGVSVYPSYGYSAPVCGLRDSMTGLGSGTSIRVVPFRIECDSPSPGADAGTTKDENTLRLGGRYRFPCGRAAEAIGRIGSSGYSFSEDLLLQEQCRWARWHARYK